MKVPRDLPADELVKLLGRHYGYAAVRQTGSHIRLRTARAQSPAIGGEHFLTVPRQRPLIVGTLNAILRDVAAPAVAREHFGQSRDEVLETLFG